MSKGLEALRKIGSMTTKRNLQDFPIGNQPKQIVKMKIKEMPEFQEVVEALNELERLKKFKETFDNYELAKKQDFIAYENWLECEKELEALKTPPTSDEVCKALSEWFKKSTYHSYIDTVFYSEKGKYFYTEDVDRSLVELIFDNYYIHEISPHLTTMIGKFYESLEEMK